MHFSGGTLIFPFAEYFLGKLECFSLPKESCQISDDKVDQNNINFVKKFDLFKSGVLDDFDRLKQAFFSEVKRFKEELLESNVVDRPHDMSERLVKQLHEHTEFLRGELRSKNNMINCLLEQLLKRDNTGQGSMTTQDFFPQKIINLVAVGLA